MEQRRDWVSTKGCGPETLLFGMTKDGTMKIGLPPRHHQDNYPGRAAVLGKLENVSHVLCSPEGELFCVREGDLYRGPMPSIKDAGWFSTARIVGKCEWSKYKILFFHPNGELYGTTHEGEFYKGPQPNNENVPWMYEQATKIGAKGWEHCEVLFFDPSGVLYTVNRKDKLMKGEAPSAITAQEYERWVKSSRMVGEKDWLKISHFLSFHPDGKLWAVDKKHGQIYRGSIPDHGKYLDNAENLGSGYHNLHFLSFTKDKIIRDIIRFDFLPEHGHRVSENVEVIEERIYDNINSSIILKHNFTFEKTLTGFSSFSHDHGFTFELGTMVNFTAGIPFFAKNETEVRVNTSTTHTWSYTTTNETEVKFSSSSLVEVLPGRAIRVVATVVKAVLTVPYRAKVRTIFGFETEIEGTWTGTTHYNLTVRQEDYGIKWPEINHERVFPAVKVIPEQRPQLRPHDSTDTGFVALRSY